MTENEGSKDRVAEQAELLGEYFDQLGVNVDRTKSAQRVKELVGKGELGSIDREEVWMKDGVRERVYTIPLHNGMTENARGELKKVGYQTLTDLTSLGFKQELNVPSGDENFIVLTARTSSQEEPDRDF